MHTSIALSASLLVVFVFASCGNSVDRQIELLAAGGEELERAKQELLIAKGDAVPALFEAMEDPRHVASRAELAEVLVGLMLRVDNPRIAAALKSHLTADPLPLVRTRIAREVGLHKLPEFSDALIVALRDTAGAVRTEALRALAHMQHTLGPADKETLIEAARTLSDDSHREAAIEAAIIVAKRVDGWLSEAHKEALKGQLGKADSLYRAALTFSPTSDKAHLRLGRFYFDNGEHERGLQVLSDGGWLARIPRFSEPPQIDGHLDEPVWGEAVALGPFVTWGSAHGASIPSKVNTKVSVGYTEDQIFFGFHCEDAFPDSIIVLSDAHDDDEGWSQDFIEFFLDADVNFDSDTVYRLTINTAGAITDASSVLPDDLEWHYDWDAESQAAGYVGEGFWSLECRVTLGQPYIPKPEPGALWGVNIHRGYRLNVEISQWRHTYWPGPPQDSFGWFLFM
jgi:hypothetical protein